MVGDVCGGQGPTRVLHVLPCGPRMQALRTARWLSVAIVPLLKSNLNYKMQIAMRCGTERDKLTLLLLQRYVLPHDAVTYP